LIIRGLDLKNVRCQFARLRDRAASDRLGVCSVDGKSAAAEAELPRHEKSQKATRR
jgi:hypothetical protein